MQSFMLRKGLIDSSMDEAKLQDFLDNCGEDEHLNQNRNNTGAKRRHQRSHEHEGSIAGGLTGASKINCQEMSPSSDTTIYKNAVEVVEDNRNVSTSSGDMIDTSDENIDMHALNSLYISHADNRCESVMPSWRDRNEATTSDGRRSRVDRPEGQAEPTPEEQADCLIREAEHNKARMLDVQGESNELSKHIDKGTLLHSVVVDEGYLTVAAHIDEQLYRKILNFEYIDFSKLLPRDRLTAEDDNCLTFVNKGGIPFLVPASDSREHGAINSYSKWDQAFRVYTDIVTAKLPFKTTELIQYQHVIYTASQTYIWDNVYAYDRDFRMHISCNPFRTWAVILQQAWSMRLKDRLGYNANNNFPNRSTQSQSPSTPKRELCRRFQRGKCHYGLSCKFEHRCAICNKFGHGAHVCR